MKVKPIHSKELEELWLNLERDDSVRERANGGPIPMHADSLRSNPGRRPLRCDRFRFIAMRPFLTVAAGWIVAPLIGLARASPLNESLTSLWTVNCREVYRRASDGYCHHLVARRAIVLPVVECLGPVGRGEDLVLLPSVHGERAG
jgi:hypothetical protein